MKHNLKDQSILKYRSSNSKNILRHSKRRGHGPNYCGQVRGRGRSVNSYNVYIV